MESIEVIRLLMFSMLFAIFTVGSFCIYMYYCNKSGKELNTNLAIIPLLLISMSMLIPVTFCSYDTTLNDFESLPDKIISRWSDRFNEEDKESFNDFEVGDRIRTTKEFEEEFEMSFKGKICDIDYEHNTITSYSEFVNETTGKIDVTERTTIRKYADINKLVLSNAPVKKPRCLLLIVPFNSNSGEEIGSLWINEKYEESVRIYNTSYFEHYSYFNFLKGD